MHKGLEQVYKERLEGVDIDSLHDLHFLADYDVQKLMYALNYMYLTNREVNYEIKSSSIILAVVSSMVKEFPDKSYFDYFNTYFDLDELSNMFKKIVTEEEMLRKRNEFKIKLSQ